MKATAEIQVIPIGQGVSLRKQVERAHGILADSGLNVQLHAFGTNVDGELSDILRLVEQLHETLHGEGVVRLATTVKIGTRTDKVPTLKQKRL
jgi:uncharacterized protein (TIGR00106 family)